PAFPSANHMTHQRHSDQQPSALLYSPFPRSNASYSAPSIESGHSVSVSDVEMDHAQGFDVPISSFPDIVSGKGKRKASEADLGDDTRPGKPRTLGGDRQREVAA